MYLLGLLRASLDRYLSNSPTGNGGTANGTANTPDVSQVKARASGYLFGLNAMGMCILRLPAAVVEIEAPKLNTPVMDVSYHESRCFIVLC